MHNTQMNANAVVAPKDELVESLAYWTNCAANAKDDVVRKTCEQHAKLYSDRLDERNEKNMRELRIKMQVLKEQRKINPIEMILVTPFYIFFQIWRFIVLSAFFGFAGVFVFAALYALFH